jgi:CheY-like chemotaxis protein
MIRALDVLVVEDEPNTREIAELLLADLGHRVTACRDGEEAVALCDGTAGRHFDVVLMDVQMPGMDGLEAIRRLRASGSCRTVPIVCVSARSGGSTREDILRAGGDRFLTKPIPQDVIFQAVTDLLHDRGLLEAGETFA